MVYFSEKYIPAERNCASQNRDLLVIFKACPKVEVLNKGTPHYGFY